MNIQEKNYLKYYLNTLSETGSHAVALLMSSTNALRISLILPFFYLMLWATKTPVQIGKYTDISSDLSGDNVLLSAVLSLITVNVFIIFLSTHDRQRVTKELLLCRQIILDTVLVICVATSTLLFFNYVEWQSVLAFWGFALFVFLLSGWAEQTILKGDTTKRDANILLFLSLIADGGICVYFRLTS